MKVRLDAGDLKNKFDVLVFTDGAVHFTEGGPRRRWGARTRMRTEMCAHATMGQGAACRCFINRDARPSNEKASSTLEQHSDFICRKKGLDR